VAPSPRGLVPNPCPEYSARFTRAEHIDPGSTITIQNVTVYDPTDQTVAQWLDLNVVLADMETTIKIGELTASTEGQHMVYAEATGCPIRRARLTIQDYRIGVPNAMMRFCVPSQLLI
jgi:hypothetical protein